MNDVKEQGLTKVLKSLRTYKTTGRGSNKSVSCDPYIWMLIAMELNPEIYAIAVFWLGDTLLLNRIEAGSTYPVLCKAVARFGGEIDYAKLGQALNYIVFGKHEHGIRNNATKEQLQALNDLEKNLTYSINMGHVKSFDDLLNDLRTLYHNRWNQLKLIA